MKIVHAFPEVDTKCPHSNIKKRKPVRIPWLWDNGRHLAKVPDREVIEILLHRLRTGESEVSISRRTGHALHTVRHWVDGSNRAKCLRIAQSIYAKETRAKLTLT
jgi:hypothetical protein